MIAIVTDAYVTGLILYALLQLVTGGCSGTENLTVKWRVRHTYRIRAIYGAIFMSVFWFIVLPVQIYQHLAEVRHFKRERAARHARYDGRY